MNKNRQNRQAELLERNRLAWNIIQAMQHFKDKPRVTASLLADEFPLTELQMISYRLKSLAMATRNLATAMGDEMTRENSRQLLKLAASIEYTLDMQ